jgi:NADH-quinone oxidoreductase subunit C
MIDATELELIAHELRESFPDSITETAHHRGIATLVVAPARVLDVLEWLRGRFVFLASLHACDYLPAAPRFGIHYELLDMENADRVHVKVLVDDPGDPELPEVDSCMELFPTAEFQEREAYDMFGVLFRGHPDMRRILMPEDYEGFPQRRDFPMGGEPVLFTHNEHRVPRWFE